MVVPRSPAVKKKNAKWYADNYYTVEDDIFAVFEKMDTPFLDKRIKPGMKVLDAMMGRGRHALRYAQRGCTVQANDLNPHMVAVAKRSAKHVKLTKKNISFSVLDATKLKGVPSNKFDVTFAMFSAVGTIPGSKNRQAAMNAMSRVTKSGGMVIVHAHNRLDAFFEKDFIGWAVQTTLWPGKLETGDIVTDYNGLQGMFNHFYTPAEFRTSFKKAGLQVVEEQYMDYGTCKFLKGPLRKIKADGFIFVGKKA